MAMNVSLPLCLHRIDRVDQSNTERVLSAWAGMPARFRYGWTLAVVDPGGESIAALSQMVRQFALVETVRLLTRLSTEDTEVLTAAADVVACPRLDDELPADVLSAMSRSKAVLISDAPQLRESVNLAAWRVDPEDTAAISRCLSRMLSDSLMRKELGREARRRAEAIRIEQSLAPIVDTLTLSPAPAA